MEGAIGSPSAPLIERLVSEGQAFEFFQAVRILEAWWAEYRQTRSLREPDDIGHDGDPSSEAVHLRVAPSLRFASSVIHHVEHAPAPGGEPEDANSPIELFVTFMGMFGPHGALPDHYTRTIIDRGRAKDRAFREFLDLFNHRLISLFFRAWEKYRFPTAYEKSHRRDRRDDPFSGLCYSILGFGLPQLRDRHAVSDEALLYYGGLFLPYPRSAVALEGMLAETFGAPVEIRQFVGQWLPLSEQDRSALPSKGAPEGRNAAMGLTLVAGSRVWDVESKFLVRIGPLGFEKYREFLPGGQALKAICSLVRTYVGIEFDFAVQPVLRAEEIPPCSLDRKARIRPQLGRTSWVRHPTIPPRRDFDGALFSIPGG